MAIKDQFFARGKFQIQAGDQTRFWEDWWRSRPFDATASIVI